MKVRVLIGEGEALEQAHKTATGNGLDYIKLKLPSPDRYNFNLDLLFAHYPAADTEVFVALDERAVNYARHKLIADVRLAGYRLGNIVSSKAIIDDDVRLLGNVYIGPGCNLASSSIGLGCWLTRQVTIEQKVQLGTCVTLQAGVQLGENVQIGTGSTLGMGSIALANTKVGRHCEWLLSGTLPNTLPNRSFYDALIPAGAHILD